MLSSKYNYSYQELCVLTQGKYLSDTKEMNAFLKNATRQEVDSAVSEIILTERQEKVFNLYFIKKKGRELHSGHAVRKP